MGLFSKKKGEILILDNLASMFAEKMSEDNIEFTMEPNVLNDGYTKFIYSKEDIPKVRVLTDRYGITKHSDSISEKKENKVIKFLMKVYFLATIFIIFAIIFAYVIVNYGENWEFVNNISFLTPELLEGITRIGLRIWVFNLGLSILISVLIYTIEEEMNYTTKTGVYILLINLVFFVVIILILRKILRKQGSPLGVFGGVI
ncbi:hypothetical protein RI065_05190 [Mycoplasmatota bacterium zrk1]